MYYNGKNYETLKEYVKGRTGKTKDDGDENFVWAIQEYYGSMGEFTEKDINFLHKNNFTKKDFD